MVVVQIFIEVGKVIIVLAVTVVVARGIVIRMLIDRDGFEERSNGNCPEPAPDPAAVFHDEENLILGVDYDLNLYRGASRAQSCSREAAGDVVAGAEAG